MSETLYGEEFNEENLDNELDKAERIQKSESTENDLDRKYFRQFDYGIDTKDNVIIIEGEIQSGLTFDIIAKTRLLNNLAGEDIKTFNILLNSPGGDVIETLGLIDFMKSQEKYGVKFNVIVRGGECQQHSC